MDQVLMLAALVALAVVLARVVRRMCGADVPLGWPLGRESRERFWSDTMPWPHGVQEDSEIAWHVPAARAPTVVAPPRPVDAGPVPPTRPQPRFTGR